MKDVMNSVSVSSSNIHKLTKIDLVASFLLLIECTLFAA